MVSEVGSPLRRLGFDSRYHRAFLKLFSVSALKKEFKWAEINSLYLAAQGAIWLKEGFFGGEVTFLNRSLRFPLSVRNRAILNV